MPGALGGGSKILQYFSVINKVDQENVETSVPSVHSVVLFVLLIKIRPADRVLTFTSSTKQNIQQ